MVSRMSWRSGGAGGFADEEAAHFDGEDDGDEAEEDADGDGAGGVPSGVVGEEGHADGAEGGEEAEDGAGVFEEDDGEFGGFGVADELPPACAFSEVVGGDDGGAEGVALEGDAEEEDGDGDAG